MIITYKYPLLPTNKQRKLIEMNFKASNYAFNFCLELMGTAYKEGLAIPDCNTCEKILGELKMKPEYSFIREADSMAIHNSLKRVADAYWKYAHHPQNKRPRAKAEKRYRDSYVTIAPRDSKIKDGCIKLPKIGWVKFILYRPLPDAFKAKALTVVRDHKDKYSVSILMEVDRQKIPASEIDPDKIVGLDFSMRKLFVDSNGKSPNRDALYIEAEKRLIKGMSEIAPVKYGSKSYGKKERRLAQLRDKIVRRRNDYLHQLANQIADTYDCVCIEDLNLENLDGKHNYSPTLANTGWSSLQKLLKYKLEERGKYLIKVGRTYPSSQLCSCCGYRNIALRDWHIREWECPNCGAHHDRDINAAINIRNEGMRILAENTYTVS